jgi:two-component sensor histidine kinase
MITGHAERAAKFAADDARAHWHDQALWFVRAKRDRAASAVPDWERLRGLASAIKAHTQSRLADYLEEFERNAVAAGARVHWARDAEEHNAIVHRILEERGATRLVKSKSMLTEECHHRLLNNLQMIVGLLLLQSRKEANAEAASRLSIAADRVRAIAGLHHHLHSMDGTPTVEFKPYLDLLCRDHSTMSMSEERPDQVIAVEAIELSLPTTIGIPLSLIVNELVTNAIKHGRGRITVKLAQTGKGHALSVCNEGSDLPEGFDPAASKGLGMTLVSSLAAQIGGELRIDRGDDNECTRFTVLFI